VQDGGLSEEINQAMAQANQAATPETMRMIEQHLRQGQASPSVN